jgi:hypothetical protein
MEQWKNVKTPSETKVSHKEGRSYTEFQMDGVSQQQETVPLIIPHLNRLFESSFVRDERSVSNPDDVAVIPSQHRVTQQLLSH